MFGVWMVVEEAVLFVIHGEDGALVGIDCLWLPVRCCPALEQKLDDCGDVKLVWIPAFCSHPRGKGALNRRIAARCRRSCSRVEEALGAGG